MEVNNDTKEIKALKGWLIVFPVLLIFQIINSCVRIYMSLTWASGYIFESTSIMARLAADYTAIYSLSFLVAIIIVNINLLFHFFTKSYKFPILYIKYSVLFLLITIVQIGLKTAGNPYITIEDQFIKHYLPLTQNLVVTALCYHYLIVSVRVKNIFVRGRPKAQAKSALHAQDT